MVSITLFICQAAMLVSGAVISLPVPSRDVSNIANAMLTSINPPAASQLSISTPPSVQATGVPGSAPKLADTRRRGTSKSNDTVPYQICLEQWTYPQPTYFYAWCVEHGANEADPGHQDGAPPKDANPPPKDAGPPKDGEKPDGADKPKNPPDQDGGKNSDDLGNTFCWSHLSRHFDEWAFIMRGRHWDKAKLGDWGHGLLDNLRSCGEPTLWGFDYLTLKDDHTAFEWEASWILPNNTRDCIDKAAKAAGGTDAHSCTDVA